MTAFSLGARLSLGANSTLALSLPQSFVAAKRRQKPAPSSEGAEAATAASHRIAKARAAVKPAVGGLPSSGTALRRTVPPSPKGKAKAATAAEHIFPLRERPQSPQKRLEHQC